MTTNTSPGQTSMETSRTAATQPVFSRSSARGRSASGVPITFPALRPKIFQIPSARMSGEAPFPLEEADGLPLLVDVDVHGGGCLPVAGHRLHVAAERDDPARPRVGAQVAHPDRESYGRVLELRVVGEGEVRLGHADRHPVVAQAVELLD